MGAAAARYRHSRVSGNPAVAGQDCGIIQQYRRDSRLSGNDGRGAANTIIRQYRRDSRLRGNDGRGAANTIIRQYRRDSHLRGKDDSGGYRCMPLPGTPGVKGAKSPQHLLQCL